MQNEGSLYKKYFLCMKRIWLFVYVHEVLVYVQSTLNLILTPLSNPGYMKRG